MKPIAVFLALALLTFPAAAQEDAEAAWAAFAEPGSVALLRHALAPGTGDPANFTLGDCTTQRNLSAEGRTQAERIGAAIRAKGIAVERVLTSQWCRCRETAALLEQAEVEDFPALNSFFADRSTRDAQTAELHAFLAGLPSGEKAILVTHQVNITALTGVYPASGELIVIRSGTEGAIEVLGRIPTLE
ncbi:MAG: histidine phosphatase family protein [Rhodovibrionaceae bacterium]